MPDPLNDTPRLHIIATQHLDVAWLWTRVPQGEDLMRQCFEAAIAMIEADPTGRFVFSRSTAWSFWIMQQRYPQLFERVRQHVASGRLELCGGEWVEPDHLIPDGESLVRQMALGQWYYQETFGKTACVCWDPDLFGHPDTLPQIIRKAGMGGYYFHRCRPHDADGNPLHQFLWEGLDGSTIAGMSGQWVGKPDPARLTAAAHELARTGLPATHVACGSNSDRRITMTPAWVDLPDEWAADPDLPACRWSTAGEALADMETYADRLPVVRGELGYSYTGTYTSNRYNKRWIRRLEFGLVQAEQLATWAGLHRFPYPAEQLTQAWRDLCVNEFHDIACGCSYAEVHREDRALFGETAARADWVSGQAAAFLSHLLHVNRRDVPESDRAYAVFGTVAWPHTTPVILPIEAPGPVAVSDGGGRVVPAQQVVREDGRPGLLILHETDGASLSGYHLAPGSPAEAGTAIARPYVLENDFLRAELSPETGEIVRLTDKRMQVECLPSGGRANRFVFLEEANLIPGGPSHSWQPWNIQLTGRELDGGTVQVTVRETGPLRGVIRIERQVHLAADLPETRIVQDIMLYRHSPVLHFVTHGDWQARQVMLRAVFDLPFAAARVAADMPYGMAERAPHGEPQHVADADNLLEDRRAAAAAIPEPDRPMLKWLDVSDGQRGLLFLNDGLNGYHATASELGLSLLRAPLMRPERDEITGLGPFEFSYALMPHAGDWRTVGAPRLGYEFNAHPVIAPIQDGRNDGVGCAWWRVIADTAPAPLTRFLTLDGEGILLTTAKRAEAEDALVVRLVESLGRPTTANLTCPASVESASECDLLERTPDDPACALKAPAAVRVNDRELGLRFAPFEIKTVLIRLRPCTA